MLSVRAHIENNNFKSIKIFVLESLTGVIVQSHEINKKPSDETLQEAYDWVYSKYLNIDVTIRGFDGNIQKNIINTTGKVRKNTYAFNENSSSSIPTFEEYVGSQNIQIGPDSPPGELRDALRQYDEFLKASGLSNITVDGAPPETECLDTTTVTLEDDIAGEIAEIGGEKYATKPKMSLRDKLIMQALDGDLFEENFAKTQMKRLFDSQFKKAVRNLPPSTRKAIELDGLPEAVKEKIRQDTGYEPKNYIRGALGDHLVEAVPKISLFKGDKVLSSANNSSIILTSRIPHR